MNDLTETGQPKVARYLKWGLGVAAVLALGAISVALTLSIWAIAAAGVSALIVVHGAPWASEKLANLFLGLRKKEAQNNPITTRERISAENWQRLALTKREIEALDAEVQLWSKQISGLPEDERGDFAVELQHAQQRVTVLAQAWKDAETQAQAYDKLTEKVRRKWQVAQTGMRIKRLTEKDKVAQINTILSNEAAESADRAMATAFSSLDSILERAKSGPAPALTHNPSPALVVDVSVKEKVQR